MESVENNINALNRCKILVVGDAMLDCYWFGESVRISPEAPVPVVAVSSREQRLGGAGNVACNIVALGARCTLLAVVGADKAGDEIKKLASAADIEHNLILQPKVETTVKIRMVSRNQQLLRADFESPLDAATMDKVAAKFAKIVGNYQCVIFSDYGKGCLGKIENLIEIANAKGVAVLVDPKSDDFSRYRGADLVTPNLKEFEQVVGRVANDEDMKNKAVQLIKKHNLKKLLITMGDRGMTLFSDTAAPMHQAARVSEIHDVVGAGDTVIAVAALVLACGLDLRVGLKMASHAAGVVVSKLGTAAVSAEELQNSLREEKL